MGCDRSGSDSSENETLLGSPAQDSDSSSPTPPKSGKEVPSKIFSLRSELAATDLIGTSLAKDTKKDEAEEDTEKYWLEKDGEQLVVIADMEKTMATMKKELANTINAFQMASGANNKLQAELNKKNTSLLQVEEDRNHLVHNLNVAEMENENLKKELAHSRRDHKYQFDRAEEALTLIEADSNKESTAKLLQAKAEAESRNMTQVESEMDFLKSHLKERCDSPVMTEYDHLVVAAAKEEAVQESPDISEAWSKREFDHTARSPVLSPTTVDQAKQAVTGSSVVAQDRGCISSDDVVPTPDILSPGGTGEGARDSHRPRVVLEDNCSTDITVEEGSGHIKEASNNNDATAADHRKASGDSLTATIRMIEANVARVKAIDGTPAEKRKAWGECLKAQTVIFRAEFARWRAESNLRKQPLFAGEKTVSAPGASTEPKSSDKFEPSSMSNSGKATNLSNSDSSNGPNIGGTFDFRTSKNPPPSLFAKPIGDSNAKSGEESTAPEALRISKAAEAANPSTTGKGNRKDIGKDVPFAAAGKKSFEFTPPPATDLEAKLKGQSPVFKSFSFPKNKTSASENFEAKQGSEATEAQKEAITSTRENDISFSQPQGFNFGGNSGPVSFTASSPSFPAGATQPAATGIFAFKEQVSPSVTIQPKEKVVKEEVAMFKKDMPKIDIPNSREETLVEETPEVVAPEDESPHEKNLREKKLRKKMLREGNAAKEETPNKATPPSASEPSRNEKRAAKKEQEKAAKNAEKEAIRRKAQASRRVQQAMGMK